MWHEGGMLIRQNLSPLCLNQSHLSKYEFYEEVFYISSSCFCPVVFIIYILEFSLILHTDPHIKF